jgi:hypothetical protein
MADVERMNKLGLIIEESIKQIFVEDEKPSFVIALALPSSQMKVRYLSNLDRNDAIKVMRETADQIEGRMN